MNPALHPWLKSALKAHVTQKEAELQRIAKEYTETVQRAVALKEQQPYRIWCEKAESMYADLTVRSIYLASDWATVVNDIKKLDPTYPISTEIHKVLKP